MRRCFGRLFILFYFIFGLLERVMELLHHKGKENGVSGHTGHVFIQWHLHIRPEMRCDISILLRGFFRSLLTILETAYIVFSFHALNRT